MRVLYSMCSLALYIGCVGPADVRSPVLVAALFFIPDAYVPGLSSALRRPFRVDGPAAVSAFEARASRQVPSLTGVTTSDEPPPSGGGSRFYMDLLRMGMSRKCRREPGIWDPTEPIIITSDSNARRCSQNKGIRLRIISLPRTITPANCKNQSKPA